MSLFDASDEIESVLFVQREISVYKVPPLESMAGYKEPEWGLENPLWKGRLRVLEKESTGVVIVLEDGQTGAPFARAPYTDDSAVQSVLDSSRYFVLRVQDPNTGNKAHIGIGFTDRAESFDFNVALQDYKKRKEAPAKLEESAAPSRPKVDYSLKEGQTFKISIPGGKPASSSNASSSTAASSSGVVPLLPPPPGGGRRP
ncbi:adaptin ear-binding coat-associated protein 1 NECAP-1 [Serendipita vermifera]|nr:adaptin ear-binding coat-associated protein 1 NECAP-1 [Serendipita vermifera]